MNQKVNNKSISLDGDINTYIGRDNIIKQYASYTENSYELLKKTLKNRPLNDISEYVKEIDKIVLNTVRKIDPENTLLSKPASINSQYLNLITKEMSNKKIELDHFLQFINNGEWIIPHLACGDMEIFIHQNLDQIKYEDFKGNCAVVNKPNLLWDCNKDVVEARKYSNCPIHSQFRDIKIAKDFSALFYSGLIKISFQNLNIFWQDIDSLWPPSMDTLHLIKTLQNLGYGQKNIQRVLDIGSGTGVIGIWLAKFNKNICDVSFADWLLLPLVFSYYNSNYNQITCNKNFLFGFNTNWTDFHFSKNKYDLIVCNPPYLPDLGFEKVRRQSTTSGTDLLSHMISYFPSYSDELVVSFSNIALPEAQKAADKHGIDLLKCCKATHTLPFRIPKVFAEKNYIKELVAKRGLEYKPNHDIYEYWHKVSTYVLTM